MPAIGSDITVISSMVESERNGLLFQKGDAAGLADRIRRLADDPGLCDRLADGARRESERFDRFGPMVERYRVLYDRLMSARRLHAQPRSTGDAID